MSVFLCFSESDNVSATMYDLLNNLPSHLCQSSVRVVLYQRRANKLTTSCSGIRVFGELEFWLSSIKVLTLIGL